jgi:site-specific DNA recombinase
MANPDFFKETFFEHATNGCIGDPDGKISWAYLRVSSSGQAEEGRSGLPRQIKNCDDIARKKGLKVPWELVFADDDSGFEFTDRKQLTELRKSFRSKNRPSDIIIIEYLDRLSRNSDWHQGFLLDEMRKLRIEPVFWKPFNSRIERTVMGAISQDGMEQALERMSDGNIHKAETGRVTARTPAYGYKIVDSLGEEGDRAKRDTHYKIFEEESKVVEYIYKRIAYDGISLRQVATELEKMYPPPKKSSHWEQKLIALIVRNRVYKGEFVSHHKMEVKIWIQDDDRLDGSGKYVKRRLERPKEEWIIVPVPAIVSEQLWEAANAILDKNFKMGRRNAKEPFLLTGIVHCFTCKYTFIGSTHNHRKKEKIYKTKAYRCSSKSNRISHVIKEIGCDQSQISCNILDGAVWHVLHHILLEPERLIKVLDRQYKGESNLELLNQIKYLETSIKNTKEEDEMLYKAYIAKIYSLEETEARRKSLIEKKKVWEEDLAQLKTQTMTKEKYDDAKSHVLEMCQRAKDSGISENSSFEIKQRTIKTAVNEIILNVNEGWFTLDGVVKGKFPLNIASNPTDEITRNIWFFKSSIFYYITPESFTIPYLQKANL